MQNAEILNQISEFENLNLNDEFELENCFIEGFTPLILRPQITESYDEVKFIREFGSIQIFFLKLIGFHVTN